MKKILCFFGALALVLTSCSNDDSPSSSDGLLKKTVITNSDGEKYTINYTYDGNKIVSAIDDTGDVNAYYTYTGNLITKIEFKFPDGTIDQINTYSYNADGKLTTFLRVEPNMDWGNKEVYTYNADGTITVKSYGGDSETQTSEGSTSTVKFVNGEVSEIISESSSGSHKYTYDNKNNPTKNILGMDKIAFADGEGNGVKFNILTDTSGDGEVWTNSTFTYNDSGYPIKEVDTGSDSLGTSEYFY